MDLLNDVVTERLLLRPVTAEHVAAVVAGRRLPGWAPDFPSEGDQVIAGMLERDGLPVGSDAAFGQRLVVERGTGLAVGGIGIFGPPEDGRVEIGYGIVESRRGRGYATEAARALVQHALGLPRCRRGRRGRGPGQSRFGAGAGEGRAELLLPGRRRGAVRHHIDARMSRAGAPPEISTGPARSHSR